MGATNLIEGKYWESQQVEIPGIVTGAAYADLDTFGTLLPVPCPRFWMLTEVRFYDLDDEGIAKRLILAQDRIAVTSADNAALVVTDTSLPFIFGGPVDISIFSDLNSGQVGGADNLNRLMRTPSGLFYCQVQTRGADNIAAGSIPRLQFIGLE